MRFEHPAWLLAALGALAAGWASLRFLEPRRAAMGFPGAAELAHAAGSGRWARALGVLLKTGALVLCAVALARPQSSLRRLATLTQGIDILLAMDTSTSMRALDFDPVDRMGAAKETAKRFIEGRTADRIGLVVFGGAPLLGCPLTLDYEALFQTLADIEAGMTGVEGTAIGDGIVAAADHLRSSRSSGKVIILLTDGRNNTGTIDPLTAAKTASALGIKIYTIGTGKRGASVIPIDDPNRGRVLVPIQDDIDEDALAQVAAAAGGRYFRATSLRELAQIYAEIDRLEKSQVQRPPAAQYRDLYPWLLVPALLLLAAEMALSRTLLLRIP